MNDWLVLLEIVTAGIAAASKGDVQDGAQRALAAQKVLGAMMNEYQAAAGAPVDLEKIAPLPEVQE